MKILLYSFILFISTQSLHSQNVNGDTLPYKIGKYDIKKQEKVSALAQKLKVDPLILVKLNKFRSAQSVLVKGQRIKIPIYTKASKPKPEKKPKKEKEKKEKTKKETEKVKKEAVKPMSRDESKPASADSIIPKPIQIIKSSDYEKDKVRLILIDATLELNEAMMEGVKASLDAMDAKVENGGNGKNVNATAQKAKLAHDRTVVMPYILHIQDSLSKEIFALKLEKKAIEDRISPPKVRNDTVIVDNDIVIYEITSYADNRPPEKIIKKVITKEPVADARDKKERNQSLRDTLIVYDLSSVNNKNKVNENPESESLNPSTSRFDTTRALSPVPDIRKDTSVTLKIKIPNSNDSVVIKPLIKPATSLNSKPELRNQKSNPPLNSADSVKRIKAEFFLKRGQNAMREKNFKGAEQYLEKSIELYPNYFDAWFTLATMNDKLGSSQRALKEYLMCEKIDNTQAKLYDNIGNIYAKMKQKTDAYNAYNKALILKPDDLSALMARAAILADWKKYNEAIADYDLVLKIDRIYHYAYKVRGQVKLLTKDFSSAVDDFTRFLIFEETDPSAFFYRGLAKIGNNELLDGCLDLSTSAGMGYSAAEKAIKKSCE